MIDRQTTERIKEAANIMDVVQDYVTLKRAGANYKGLCPFHNEKTPSFVVSPARGTCHCFGCGKGGNPISFLMEIEQITYPEALRRLAAKYHIEVRERELTNEEKEEQSLRESLLIVNDWATAYFENILHTNAEGVSIGLQYLRMRGFRDDIIKKFRIGYDLNDRHALAKKALSDGHNPELITRVGLCYENDRHELIDRYSGRVVFPWVNNAGKVVGFSARVLDTRTKGVQQKYVNSPDSDIYHKDRELYGLYQAKLSIGREGYVYIVEGQADVISMHQCGIENVVAGSGTALSAHQVHLLHRFTTDITLIYDDDNAGHHAAMEGINKVLAEGMNVRIVVLPDGDDPDSFAQKHTADEFRSYVKDHQVDFIQYKTAVMLDGVNDPQKRAEGINSIVESISYVQNPILRDTYIHNSARQLGISEVTLINQMNTLIRDRKRNTRDNSANTDARETPVTTQAENPTPDIISGTKRIATIGKPLTEVEKMLAQVIIKHGEVMIFSNIEDDMGQTHTLNVAQFVDYSLSDEGLALTDPLLNRILAEALEHSHDENFKAEPFFLNHENIEISHLAATLTSDPWHYTERETEPINEEDRIQKELSAIEKLRQQTIHLVLDYKREYVDAQLKEIHQKMKTAVGDNQKLTELMAEYSKIQAVRNTLAKKLGSDILI